MARLYSPHPLALQTAWSDLKRHALEQPFVLVGTPGSVSVREVSGRPFFYRQYYDARDKKKAAYLGPVGDADADARAEATRAQIAVQNELLGTARLLSRAGYVRVDARTDAVLAALSNSGLFRAGGVLVGSHAYGALLNDLGARAPAYGTEDVDVARARALTLPSPRAFGDMLADAELDLHPVPQLDRKRPSTSYKPPGADRLRVDLLVPTAGEDVKVLEARDLGAHATGLPFLRYLLEEPLEGVVLGRSAVVGVRVPRPERLAWHKMLVSELRDATSDKKAKDLEQAAVLVAILAEREPDALREAMRHLPASARKRTRAAAEKVRTRLSASGHERAAEELADLVRSRA